jgi:NifU-like protein involved in Fe-S cluster formation
VSAELYSPAIMRLAADAVGHGRLANADGSATISNPLCGDRITVDVRLADGRIAALTHEARACVLCQASASVLAAQAAGLNGDAVRLMAARLADETALAQVPGFGDFAPVARHRSRLRCVTLPFEAAAAAIAAAAKSP